MRFCCYVSSSLRANESLMYHEIGMFNRSVVNGNSKVWPLASFAEKCFIKIQKSAMDR